jgi:hypothetical protein
LALGEPAEQALMRPAELGLKFVKTFNKLLHFQAPRLIGSLAAIG